MVKQWACMQLKSLGGRIHVLVKLPHLSLQQQYKGIWLTSYSTSCSIPMLCAEQSCHCGICSLITPNAPSFAPRSVMCCCSGNFPHRCSPPVQMLCCGCSTLTCGIHRIRKHSYGPGCAATHQHNKCGAAAHQDISSANKYLRAICSTFLLLSSLDVLTHVKLLAGTNYQ